MNLSTITFRDPVKIPGEQSYDTTSFIDARHGKLKGVPIEELSFEDGLVTIRTENGTTLVPWTNVIDMKPAGEETEPPRTVKNADGTTTATTGGRRAPKKTAAG